MNEEKFVEDDDLEEEGEEVDETTTESSIGSDTCMLTHDEACKCLHTLGKCDSGHKYAYLGLDASNRRLTDVSVISSFKHIVFVNVSNNRLTIEALRVLTAMTYLLMLQADRNEIDSAVMEPMRYLQVLTLNKNNLTDTAGIEHKLLVCLELNYNKISAVTLNPFILENLKTLEMRGNSLTSTSGIFFPELTRLYLAENKIDTIEGLQTLINLKILHLRDNRLSNLDGFDSKCAKLNYVNLRGNRIGRISELEKLSCLPALETLVVLENPIVDKEEDEEEEPFYRRLALVMLPNLKKLDKDPVLRDEMEEARDFRQQMIDNNQSFRDFDYNIEEK